jgi:hypothetical protein
MGFQRAHSNTGPVLLACLAFIAATRVASRSSSATSPAAEIE